MEHSAQICLPSHFYCHTTTIYTGMCAQVVMAGSQSSSFSGEMGVKQGCVLAQIIFNLRRLQANTKTSSAMISALQYADDAAFPSLTADGLQCSLDVISETYLCAGLMINTTKTGVLSTSSPDAPTFFIIGNQLRNSENFTY